MTTTLRRRSCGGTWWAWRDRLGTRVSLVLDGLVIVPCWYLEFDPFQILPTHYNLTNTVQEILKLSPEAQVEKIEEFNKLRAKLTQARMKPVTEEAYDLWYSTILTVPFSQYHETMIFSQITPSVPLTLTPQLRVFESGCGHDRRRRQGTSEAVIPSWASPRWGAAPGGTRCYFRENRYLD